jgi:hypothetical protein
MIAPNARAMRGVNMSPYRLFKYALLASAAAIVMEPGPVFAQGRAKAASNAELQARLQALEAQMQTLQSELSAAKAQAASAQASAQATAAAAEPKLIELQKKDEALGAQVAAVEKKLPGDGFKVGDTTVKISGFVKAEALASDFKDGVVARDAFLRDFYVPGQIPVGPGANAGQAFDAHAKQTRLAITVNRAVDKHKLSASVEGDFQSAPGTQFSERTTNATDFALRRAYVTFDNWLFGQDWSTFQNVAVLPETTDFIGPTEGTVFVRQAQARYTRKLNDKVSLQFAAENAETSSITPTSAALVENDSDRIPDFVGRLNFKGKAAEFSLAAIGRELVVDTGAFSDEQFGWGVSAGGKVMLGKKNDVRFMLSGGEGIGRYLGLNFAPDVVAISTGANRRIEKVPVLSGFVAGRFYLSEKVRTTLSFSLQQVDNDRAISPLTANKQVWSAFGNIFYSPVKGFDLGIEYRHAERELENGQKGELNRLHVVAKQSF